MKKVFIFTVIGFISFISCRESMKKGVYEGKDISNEASIIRNKNTKQASLSISTTGPWKLYVGESPDKIDYNNSYTGEGKGMFPLEVSDSVRSYFQLVTDEGKAILAEKVLPMAGGHNFRDLGGIRNRDGKYVKWVKFIRTDELGSLTDEDLRYLASIPIRSIVDFRTESEIKSNPDCVPSSVNYRYDLSISPGNLNPGVEQEMNFSKMNMDSVMIAINEAFVTDTAIINLYREFFKQVQDEKNIPMIFHCTAGKDRTGFAAAMILFALGVDEETVMRDYLQSNIYLKDKYQKIVEEYPNLAPLLSVKPEFLGKAIQTIKEKHGSIENYLTNVLNVDIEKFRELYLY